MWHSGSFEDETIKAHSLSSPLHFFLSQENLAISKSLSCRLTFETNSTKSRACLFLVIQPIWKFPFLQSCFFLQLNSKSQIFLKIPVFAGSEFRGLDFSSTSLGMPYIALKFLTTLWRKDSTNLPDRDTELRQVTHPRSQWFGPSSFCFQKQSITQTASLWSPAALHIQPLDDFYVLP